MKSPGHQDEPKVFTGVRQRIVNLVTFSLLGAFFVFLAADVWSTDSTQRSTVPAYLLPVIVFVFVALVRSCYASRVEITGDKLIYRRLWWTQTFRREEVSSCEVKKMVRGAGQVWMLVLVLKNGSAVRFAELNEGIRGSIGVVDTYNPRLKALEDAVNQWLTFH